MKGKPMRKKRTGIVTAIIAAFMLMVAGPAMAQESKESDPAGDAANAIGGVLEFTLELTGNILGMVGKLLGGFGEAFKDAGSGD